MSRIERANGEPIEVMARQRLTRAERRTLLGRQGFRCAACPEPLTLRLDGQDVLGAMVDEHVIPLALGGSNDLSNRELRCPSCAKTKTSQDLKAILKAKRIQRRRLGETPAKAKIRSRGFPRDSLSWRNAEDQCRVEDTSAPPHGRPRHRLDYRGEASVSGTVSEEGVVLDKATAWQGVEALAVAIASFMEDAHGAAVTPADNLAGYADVAAELGGVGEDVAVLAAAMRVLSRRATTRLGGQPTETADPDCE